jgi:hypothetical protein
MMLGSTGMMPVAAQIVIGEFAQLFVHTFTWAFPAGTVIGQFPDQLHGRFVQQCRCTCYESE